MPKSDSIVRYNNKERVNHWSVAVTFVLLMLSGLALFHPSMYWLTNLFGGGTWTRILHPFIGVVMFLSFGRLAARFWAHNRWTDDDSRWMARFSDLLNNREDRLPEVGRYNGGQKIVFWVSAACVAILLVTGVVLWQPYFTPVFPIWLVRLAALLHAFSAFVMILTIIVHVYAAIWADGSTRAMLYGTVSPAWAKKHHAAWFRDVSKGAK